LIEVAICLPYRLAGEFGSYLVTLVSSFHLHDLIVRVGCEESVNEIGKGGELLHTFKLHGE
jgi:hypothetical protein